MSKVRIILGIAIIALVVLTLFSGVTACQKIFNQKKQLEVVKDQNDASIGSGVEAMNTVSAVANADRDTDKSVKEATNEVRKAPPGNSNDAALRAACRLHQYRDSERCAALRGLDPPKPSGAR
jgi:FtsZ-interacting cell division protein ZipA